MAGNGAVHAASLSSGKIAALKLLKQALEDAEDAGQDVHQFAVTRQSLTDAGATESDLRWLVAQRYVSQLHEITQNGDSRRSFQTVSSLRLAEAACFVLSHGGKIYVALHGVNCVPEPVRLGSSEANSRPADRIRWDRERHELWVDGKLAKRFTRRAQAQWAALDAFQAAEWQAPLELALPGGDQRNPAQRIRELVAELNKNLDKTRIRFRKDCEGNCISYDLPSVAANAPPAKSPDFPP